MNKKSPCRSACAVSRRRLLQVSAFGVLAVGAARAQENDPAKSFKATKQQAGYIDKDQPGAQSCSTCHSYVEPAECQLVEGPVSPWGWCNWFSD